VVIYKIICKYEIKIVPLQSKTQKGTSMTTFFYEGLILNLPTLAETLLLSSNEFKVLKVMGGGMGICAKIQACDGTSYAVKVIYQDSMSNEEAMARYITEVKSWLTLSACEGVAEAICITKINDIPCVVSKWMEGGDLIPHMNNKNKIFFYKTIERIILTLQWAYNNHHTIHRDIKPANILLDENQNAFITDWGLAKDLSKKIEENKSTQINKNNNPELTEDGSFLGTVSYASPEQILGKKDIDFRTDIYSLGCMMYEWETGNRPFIGKTCEEIAISQINDKPKKIGSIFVGTNYGVEKIILKCLEKSPADRYQSYDELLSDFYKIANKKEQFQPSLLKERFNSVKIGYDEFIDKLRNKKFNAIYGTKGYAIMSEEDIQPYLWEAINLLGLGEWQKAVSILERLYNPDFIKKMPDSGFNQFIANNLSYGYCRLGKRNEALAVILTIKEANNKTADYYVNLSCILIEQLNFIEARNVCTEALSIYPDDKDLQSNLTRALLGLNDLEKASESAHKRLILNRDVDSLIDAASLSVKIAQSRENTDYPTAYKYYTTSRKYYQEAEYLNPQNTIVKYGLANVLFYLNKYSESSEKIAEISKINNATTATDIWYLARNIQYSCSPNDCKSFCEKWLKVYPEDIKLKTIYAQLLFESYCLGQINKDGFPIITQQCIDHVNRVIKGKPDELLYTDYILAARILFWIANGVTETERKGVDMLKEQLKKQINTWECDFYLASYYANIGNFQEAIIWIDQAIKKAPWRESCYSLAAQIYKASGNEELASIYQTKIKQISEKKKNLLES